MKREDHKTRYSEGFLADTIRIWQPYSSEPISMEDAEEIAHNMGEFFEYLIYLDEKYGKEENEI